MNAPNQNYRKQTAAQRRAASTVRYLHVHAQGEPGTPARGILRRVVAFFVQPRIEPPRSHGTLFDHSLATKVCTEGAHGNGLRNSGAKLRKYFQNAAHRGPRGY